MSAFALLAFAGCVAWQSWIPASGPGVRASGYAATAPVPAPTATSGYPPRSKRTAAAQGAPAQPPERVSEIRIHGNHTTPDADVLRLSGLAVGDPASEARLAEAAGALRRSGRFAAVDLRRRYLSIDDPARILIMIVVDERASVSEADPVPGPLKRMRAAGMWLPILSGADGYGFTYGARVSFIDALGPRTRVSVPLTWGGERRAALDLERAFGEGPVVAGPAAGPGLLLRGSLSVYRRVNPHFDVPDVRQEARLRAETPLTPWLRVATGGRTARVDFGGVAERHDAVGADVTVDTRIDPSFPRNAVHATTGWERLRFESGRAGRWTTDARAYVGVGGSTVVAVRGQMVRANAPLPPAEQSLLGGGASLRGYRTGYRAGANLAALSVEGRIPLNSPLRRGRFGLKAFADWGKTWQHEERFADRPFDRGIGGGVYMGGGPVIADIDVAWPRSGRPRAHFGFGVSF